MADQADYTDDHSSVISRSSSNRAKDRLHEEYRRLTLGYGVTPEYALHYLASARATKLVTSDISGDMVLAILQDIATEYKVPDGWQPDTKSNSVFIKQQFVEFFDKYSARNIQSVILDEDGTIHVMFNSIIEGVTQSTDMVSQEFEADSEFRKDLENLFWDRE